MDNKLQELTDRLYKEGLSKGKEEGEAILAEASRKAEEIIALGEDPMLDFPQPQTDEAALRISGQR